jgi:ubiquinone biosynthesis protein UbiJ
VLNGPEVPLMVLFVSIAAMFIMRGPFGRAIAERIAGRARTAAEDQDVRELKGEVEELRNQLADVQERLDFAERVIARKDDHVAALPKRGVE